jgi:hypothetical protein
MRHILSQLGHRLMIVLDIKEGLISLLNVTVEQMYQVCQETKRMLLYKLNVIYVPTSDEYECTQLLAI